MTQIFNNIQIGKQFKTNSNIVYQKISIKDAKPVKDSSGNIVAGGRITPAFYNSKTQLTVE